MRPSDDPPSRRPRPSPDDDWGYGDWDEPVRRGDGDAPRDDARGVPGRHASTGSAGRDSGPTDSGPDDAAGSGPTPGDPSATDGDPSEHDDEVRPSGPGGARTTRAGGFRLSMLRSGSTPAPGGPAGASRTPPPSVALRRRATAIAVAALLVLAIPVGLAVGGGTTAPEDGPPFLEGPLTSAGTFAVDRVARTTAITRFARLGLPVYCGAGNRPWVALTFDDGPGALSDRFRELLVKERAAVTLFRQGTNIAGHEDAVRAQRDLGWDSGSHTQRHAALASLPAKEQRAEIEAGNRTSRSVLGRPVRLFRPPYESHNADTDRIVEDLGMVQVLWNVDTQDALGVGVDKIVSQAKAGMRAGSIILMHETKATTLKALPQIFAEMRRRGLQPVTVSQMLAHDPPSEAQLRKGFAGCPVDVTPGKAAS